MKSNCPTCQKELSFETVSSIPYFPFCSKRCRLIDLGKWFDGSYKVSRHMNPEDGEFIDFEASTGSPQEEDQS